MYSNFQPSAPLMAEPPPESRFMASSLASAIYDEAPLPQVHYIPPLVRQGSKQRVTGEIVDVLNLKKTHRCKNNNNKRSMEIWMLSMEKRMDVKIIIINAVLCML